MSLYWPFRLKGAVFLTSPRFACWWNARDVKGVFCLGKTFNLTVRCPLTGRFGSVPWTCSLAMIVVRFPSPRKENLWEGSHGRHCGTRDPRVRPGCLLMMHVSSPATRSVSTPSAACSAVPSGRDRRSEPRLRMTNRAAREIPTFNRFPRTGGDGRHNPLARHTFTAFV